MRNDKKASSENYSFIKETIKEQPTDRKRLAGKFLTAAVCGVIFGACAAGTMALSFRRHWRDLELPRIRKQLSL